MATFTDNLDGTSGDLLSARSGWSRPTGADNAAIVSTGSGVALTTGSTAANGTWHVPTSQPSGNDQYAEALIGTAVNAFPLGVRCDTSSATGGGYLARCTTANNIELYRRSASGVLLSLGSYAVPTPSDLTTNKVRLEVVGNDLSVYFKGSAVLGPIARTDFASGSVAMLSRGGTASTTVYTADDWGSGDIGAGSQTLTPSLFTNTQTFYAPTVAPGARTLTPTLFTNTQTFYAPTVANASGPQTLTPSLFTNAQTFYAPTVSITGGVQTLTPALFTNSQTFYAATVSQPSAQTLNPSLFTNAQTFFSCSVSGVSSTLTITGTAWPTDIAANGDAWPDAFTVTGGSWN